ncbi:hypothetical protein GGI42DRAFT_358308 [Trichoderma sp. SZMC 28013]
MGNQSQYSLDGRGGDNEGQRSRSTTATRSEIESEYYGRGRGRGYSNRTARDRTSVFQPSGPTFLREASRSPPPATRDTNLDASSTTNILQKAGEFYDFRYDHVAPPAPIPTATICGLRARIFWLVLGIVVLLLAVGVGVGVGVGLGAQKHKSSAEPSPATTSTGLPHTSTSIPPTATSTSKAPSATKPPSSELLSCPTSNGTQYDVPDSQKTFLLICGIDYSGVDEAEDLTSVYTVGMEDCITSCANYSGCTGCGWGILPGDGSLHRCWLKGSLKKTHKEKTGWYFATLEGT